MADGPPKAETQLDTQGEAELASDETIPHDSSDLSAHARTPRIRISPVDGPQKLGR